MSVSLHKIKIILIDRTNNEKNDTKILSECVEIYRATGFPLRQDEHI